MTQICLFDVDGTLTPTSQKMVPEFESYFLDFIGKVPSYLVSGGEYKKLQTQISDNVLQKCQGVFGCQGSEYYENGKQVYSKQHTFDERLKFLCQTFVDNSLYPTRTGNHLDNRIGMLNVSVVGRNATQNQRDDYFLWDKQNNERAEFAKKINASDLDYEASTGGKISIDIVPTGWNKAVAAKEILLKHPNANLTFFGDRVCEGGNDLPLAKALEAKALESATITHKVVCVTGYKDTWQQMKHFPAK